MSKESEIKIKSKKYPNVIRELPHMYLGSLSDSGILIREAFDNSKDELLASMACDTVWVDDHSSKWKIVADNGRGIPITLSDEEPELTQMEVACASLHSSGKYDSTVAQAGLHGVGISCTNAVSDVFICMSKITEDNYMRSLPEVTRIEKVPEGKDRLYLYIRWEKGIKVSTKIMTVTDLSDELGVKLPYNLSTYTAFIPDLSIVKSAKTEIPSSWLGYIELVTKEFLNKSINVTYNGKLLSTDMIDLNYIIKNSIKIPEYKFNDKIDFYLTFEFRKELDKNSFKGSVNSIEVNNGEHINWIKSAISRCLKEVFDIKHNYLTNGLFFRISILAKKVGYDSQTKKVLCDIKDFHEIHKIEIDKYIKKVFDDNYDEVFTHVQRLNDYAESMAKLKEKSYLAKLITLSTDHGNSVRSHQPVKLRDCSCTNRKNAELYLVEGDSAGGSILKHRNRDTQAVITLRGVTLNPINATLEEILANREYNDIIFAIGCGIDQYNNGAKNPRYGKIIISCDADSDGYHISALILGLFGAHMKFLIELGMVYILETALYKQNGIFYYQGEEHKLDKSKYFSRFKGLGSIYEENDKKYLLTDPKTRRLKQVTIDRVEDAINCLGSTDYRRDLMRKSGIVK